MYKISIPGQAEVFFPSFDVAFAPLINRVQVKGKSLSIRENVENGDGFYSGNLSFEKVKV